MFFLIELFTVAFVMMSVFIGIGLIILAYFGRAPMPIWMQKYIRKQPTAKTLPIESQPQLMWLTDIVKEYSIGVWAPSQNSLTIAGVATMVVALVTTTQFQMRATVRVRGTVEVHRNQETTHAMQCIFLEPKVNI
ncbi:MAG: hypothetical protein AWT59_3219 [Candidatus Gallionella acididurans]|uniref:Uncharacterized protein n=1 Tax=Candidatus Gallionella acididurans TaxID=1796491 RepID=A0A139BNU8_9PROT|nr:MAG: hypothetical protein AWT59_3219 [Candidatus Gallionella acididurans]